MLPKEYASVLARDRTLLELIEDLRDDVSFADEFALLTKLRLARQVFAERLNVYMSLRANDKTRLAGATLLQEALDDYVNLAERILRVDKLLSDHISVHAVHAMLRQTERIIERELRDVVDTDRIKRALRTEVRVPDSSVVNEEEVLPPSRIASFMDAMVPGVN